MAATQKRPTIALVGAGFSGIVTTLELVQQAQKPMDIILFDPSPYAGFGVAYATDCPLHLLNVPVERMGAWHSHPEHFFTWLQKKPHKWRSLHPSFTHLDIQKGIYVPRMIYGSYLQDLCADSEALASQKSITITWNRESVVDVDPSADGFTLITASGSPIEAQGLVIGVGVPWTNQLAQNTDLKNHPGYLATPWPQLTNMEQARSLVQTKATIGLIGSGLTMLDVLATLKSVDFSGKVILVSRKGRLPLPHSYAKWPSKQFPAPSDFPTTAKELFHKVRQDCQQAQDWRHILDALRPITPTLWMRLPPPEQKKFLRHLLSIWNCHRHRVAPEALAIVDFFKSQDRIAFAKTKAVGLQAHGQQVDILTPQGPICVDLAVNCTGPDFRIAKHPCLLIQNILKRNLAMPDVLGYGFRVEARETLSKRLFAVGTLLFGTYFETIAVPEIRRQCHTIASDIVSGGLR